VTRAMSLLRPRAGCDRRGPGSGPLDVRAIRSCHCATLAHHALGLNPPASCRLSFCLYDTLEEVDSAVAAVAAVAAERRTDGLPC
jgi:hypothetical protein